jgi:hypothetical protein
VLGRLRLPGSGPSRRLGTADSRSHRYKLEVVWCRPRCSNNYKAALRLASEYAVGLSGPVSPQLVGDHSLNYTEHPLRLPTCRAPPLSPRGSTELSIGTFDWHRFHLCGFAMLLSSHVSVLESLLLTSLLLEPDAHLSSSCYPSAQCPVPLHRLRLLIFPYKTYILAMVSYIQKKGLRKEVLPQNDVENPKRCPGVCAVCTLHLSF